MFCYLHCGFVCWCFWLHQHAFLLTTALILSHNLVTKNALATRDYSGFAIDRLELLVMMIDEKSLGAVSPSSYLLFPMHGCLRLATMLTQALLP